MEFQILLGLAFTNIASVSIASTDFYFGSLSGEGVALSGPGNPYQLRDCHYIIFASGTDVVKENALPLRVIQEAVLVKIMRTQTSAALILVILAFQRITSLVR